MHIDARSVHTRNTAHSHAHLCNNRDMHVKSYHMLRLGQQAQPKKASSQDSKDQRQFVSHRFSCQLLGSSEDSDINTKM